MEFDNSYTNYWKNRVSSLSDGSKIADEEILENYLPLLDIKSSHNVLDIGCSYGRFYNILSRYANNVSGLDIEPSAITECRNLGYKDLKVCPMEEMSFANDSFEAALCWGTFDCVDQEKALLEANRILKIGGKIAITGKNYLYDPCDSAAFIAERNAKLKNFPNHFTKTDTLLVILPELGFKLIALRCFIKRGDFGLNKAIVYENELPKNFYEYLIVLEKISSPRIQE
ncbi:MAG: class I SAM-dependent methyltransferase [Janthinobacterium sp.]|jgi:SAM-dependent methyltransferase